jgi:hypothetical protein
MTSTGLYYTYVTNGSQYEVASIFESAKYKSQYATNLLDPDYPAVNAKGSNLSLSPLWNPSGLVGYWPMDEGTGTTAIDQSGNGNTGIWNGTQAGTSGYYSAGKAGTWAGVFDGSTDRVGLGNPSLLAPSSSITVAAWVAPSAFLTNPDQSTMITKSASYYFQINGTGHIAIAPTNVSYFLSSSTLPLNVFTFVVATYNGAMQAIYINGILNSSGTLSGGIPSSPDYVGIGMNLDTSGNPYIGYPRQFQGSLDDVRLYNRALSASEIQALYNAEH